jgi:hypothetical protein
MAAGEMGAFLMLSDNGWVRLEPIALTMTAKSIGLNYTWRAPVVVLPAELAAGISGAIKKAAAKR